MRDGVRRAEVIPKRVRESEWPDVVVWPEAEPGGIERFLTGLQVLRVGGAREERREENGCCFAA